MDNYQLKIIRFTNGEEIIAFVSHVDEFTISVKYPKVFFFDVDEETEKHFINVSNWLQSEFYGEDEVTLDLSNILFLSMPNVKFGSSYLKMVIKNMDHKSPFYIKIKEYLDSLDDTTKIVH